MSDFETQLKAILVPEADYSHKRLTKVSPPLAAIVGITPMSRAEVTRKLWEYIKRKGLQDVKNRRMINTDLKLEAVCNRKSQVSLFELTRYVNLQIQNIGA